MKTPSIIPPGLTYHCASCKLVVPVEAPTPDGADCAFVAQHRLAHFNPDESTAGQHVMAAACWTLIYHRALTPEVAHPASLVYKRRIHLDRKAHFAESAVRQAMTDEQVVVAKAHNRSTCDRKQNIGKPVQFFPREEPCRTVISCPDCRDNWLYL